MGRSGRRDSPSVLRMLITEPELTATSSIVDHLRLQLVQAMAMIRLMISKRWFEPADIRQKHYSTPTTPDPAILRNGEVFVPISSGHNFARRVRSGMWI